MFDGSKGTDIPGNVAGVGTGGRQERESEKVRAGLTPEAKDSHRGVF